MQPLGYENARLSASQLQPGMDVYSQGRKLKILTVKKIGNGIAVDYFVTLPDGKKMKQSKTFASGQQTDFYSMTPEEYKERADTSEAVLMDEILEKKGVVVPYMSKYFPKLDEVAKAREKAKGKGRRKTRRRSTKKSKKTRGRKTYS